MSHKKTRTYRTWEDAEAAHRTASKMAELLQSALEELVRGKVQWLEGRAPRKIGLCKLAAPHGGIVILVEREMIGAQYLTAWSDMVQGTPAPPARDYKPEYKTWLDIRRLAAAALTMREDARAKAAEESKGCSRMPLPGVVDQDVRSY